MSKTLVAYFSCTGSTRTLAQTLAKAANADLYEITPAVPYTSADLNWMDKQSRSTLEMKDASSRPAIAGPLPDLSGYDAVFVGFPIWWYVAPTIVNTFLERCDFSDKTIVPFATSGGSGLGQTVEHLRPSCDSSVKWNAGKLLKSGASEAELSAWVKSLGL